MLSRDRIVVVGQTPHLHEREAFEFAQKELPNSGPLHLFAFVELTDPGGRRYELDFLIIGTHALYLVEVKSHPGTLAGDEIDWQFTFPDGGRTLIENPLRGANHKARVLGSLLDRHFNMRQVKQGLRRPWVQPLVFLSNPDLKVKLTEAGQKQVITRAEFGQAVVRGEFRGARSDHRDKILDAAVVRETLAALKSYGLRESVGALKVEGLHVRQLLEDGVHFQDHLGEHESVSGLKRRVRCFLVPASVTAEKRDQLLRAARREAQHLAALADHKGILRLVSYVADGPQGGPCIILEHVEDAQPLDIFLRANPNLSFDQRVSIIQQVAEALDFCHRKQVIHRGLNPRAILVRWQSAKAETKVPEVRLFNFQLASAGDLTGTIHLGDLSRDDAAVYLAPEVCQDPASASPTSDVFSLGAVAFLILTGHPPGTDLAERDQRLANGYLSVSAVRNDLAISAGEQDLEDVFRMATAVRPSERLNSAIEWINELLDVVTTPVQEPEATFVRPGEALPNDLVTKDLKVVSFLGSGTTARVLRVARPDNSTYALKVALSADLDERLRFEGKVLSALSSDRIVSLVEELVLDERVCLLMTDAGESLAALLSREGPPSLDFSRRWGEDLLRALETLEERGIQHRDIKPAVVTRAA